eukprot:jgi/Ulvmu1/10342/UM061_0025.1
MHSCTHIALRPLRPVYQPARSSVCSNCVKQIRQQVSNVVLSGIAAATLLGPLQADAASQLEVSPDMPLIDQSKILSSGRRDGILSQLSSLERDTGYRVRILTKERYTVSDMDQARAGWAVDKNTVILVFDPSAPNIFGYDYIGDNILLGPLRRPFWIELQSRFGNMFYVREQGEGNAVVAIVDAVDTCLRQGGCQRVPGLPEEQYYFTLILAIAGGVICGFSFRLEPNKTASRRWFWPLLLSPLWGSVFVNFGLGPIISRTDDWQPVAQNCAAFLLAAVLFKPNPIFYKEEADKDV